jgi:hypothetical protein
MQNPGHSKELTWINGRRNGKKIGLIVHRGEFSHMFIEDVYWRTQKKCGI